MSEITDIKTGEMVDVIQERNGELVITSTAVQAIKHIEASKKELDNKYKEYKEQIKAAMEKYGVEKIETDDLLVTYIEPFERFTVDSKKLKTEHPDIYADCTKLSEVGSSVRVKLR